MSLAKITRFTSIFLVLSFMTLINTGCLESKKSNHMKKDAKNFPQRKEILSALKNDDYDLLVIGGGATGAGAFLEAASRGLKVALIEQNDYASQTSSRSTKLIHGGVRYLENAVKKLDIKEYNLVKEALHERKNFIQNAPHLTRPLPIITPVYSWFEAVYYLVGLKLYDFISKDASLGKSTFLSYREVARQFPHIKKEGLKGAIVYYDGQFNDARMDLSLILTGISEGGFALNYAMATNLTKEMGKISGAEVKDLLTDEIFIIKAKAVINATGVFSDTIRKMDDPNEKNIILSSQGTHIVLAAGLIPNNLGLIIPKTSDNRVIFLLPWLDKTIAGTTDKESKITTDPKPSKEEVDYILTYLNNYLDTKINKDQVLASWSGLRPLINLHENKSSSSVSRDHLILTSPSNLITIAGGKWTTYRKMGEDVVNEAIKIAFLKAEKSKTEKLKLVGAEAFHDRLHEDLEYNNNLASDISQHLAQSYGDKAQDVIDIDNKSKNHRLHENYPFIEAEVLYAIRNEYAVNPVDILARRLRIAFLDNEASLNILPKLVSLMKSELHWTHEKALYEEKMARDFLLTMLER